MKTDDFDYLLPEELIAQTPLNKRDSSKMLVLDKMSGDIYHKTFSDIINYLEEGDTLVLNNTKVIPARIIGIKEETNAVIELLLLKQVGLNRWQVLVRPGKKALPGVELEFSLPGFKAAILDTAEEGTRIVEFSYDGDFYGCLENLGEMPLPPYIKAELKDQERYQTVYSREVGSAAAPTAGLHFTRELLEKIRQKGVCTAFVTLHVGLGTFRPVKAEDISQHHMHSEFCVMSQETAQLLNQTKASGGRIVCVGTTSCRTLESLVNEDGSFSPKSSWTDIFIFPGYTFKAMDALITNFHLPESTLVMLVSAFAGRDHVLSAYNTAVAEKYRFFSFGDAMYIGANTKK